VPRHAARRRPECSARFYPTALGFEPQLDAPGLTEFGCGASAVLGLMPTEAIKRLLPGVPDADGTLLLLRAPSSTSVSPTRSRHVSVRSMRVPGAQPSEGTRLGPWGLPDQTVHQCNSATATDATLPSISPVTGPV
jgi:hypothetical protein